MSDRRGLAINTEPIAIVPSAVREAWNRPTPSTPRCEECGSEGAALVEAIVTRTLLGERKYQAKGWLCSNRKQCRRRQRR